MKKRQLPILNYVLVFALVSSISLNIYFGYKEFKSENGNDDKKDQVQEDPKFSFLDSIDNQTFEVKAGAGDILLKKENKHFNITLSEGERINSVRINNSRTKFSVTTILAKEELQITKLLILNISNGNIEKAFKTGDTYIKSNNKRDQFAYIYDSWFSNDERYLYITSGAGGSGMTTHVLRLSDNQVIQEFGGYVLSVLPNKNGIKDEYFKQYANDILFCYHNYYVIGGGPYLVGIINPRTGKVEELSLFELVSDGNSELQTFYNMYIF